MEESVKALDSKISTLSEELVSLKDVIASSFKKTDANFGVIEKKLSGIERKVAELNFKIDNLDTNTSTGLNEVGTKIESLTDEIAKISVVTKYDEQYRNQATVERN